MTTSAPPVRVDHHDSLAWVTIDNPPVNATSAAVRLGLADAVAKVAALPVRAAILRCAGRTFVAGGDITEFDAPPVEPHLPDVIRAIEDCPVPWIAAMHGSVFGGGLEIALGCAWRVAARDTWFALPEVALGLVPGAGGTQRLPRLVGVAMALEMATTGTRVSTEAFAAAGGLDAVVPDLDGRTLEDCAGGLGARPMNLRSRPVAPLDDAAWWADRRREVADRASGALSPMENLELVLRATQTGFDIGQQEERARHLALRKSEQSRALRHVFFAERKAARDPELTEPARSRLAARLNAAMRRHGDNLVSAGTPRSHIAAAWAAFGGAGDPFGPAPEPAGEVSGADPVLQGLLAVLINQGALEVETRCAASPARIDAIAVADCGFPRWRGGPMYYANTLDPAVPAQWMESVMRQWPDTWRLSKQLDPGTK